MFSSMWHLKRVVILLTAGLVIMSTYLLWNSFPEPARAKSYDAQMKVLTVTTGTSHDIRMNAIAVTEAKQYGSQTIDLKSRTAEVKKVCQKMAGSGRSVQDIMTNRAHKLSYCYIPKCGCTFWKRVMRFLNKDFKGKNITSPFQISRLESHVQWSNPDTFVPFKKYRNSSTSFTSFMFVREPYSRLWSAYVDKFFLPDFWQFQKKNILSKRTPSQAKKCINDVTFQEFVNLTLRTPEPHWNPMHKMCDPCIYKPTILGKVESFSFDSRFILEKANLSWILDGYDHSKHQEEEMIMMIRYNLEDGFYKKPHIKACITKVELFQRIWKAFQINGYLPAGTSFPSDAVDLNTTTSEFTEIVLHEHRRRPNTPHLWRQQRQDFMVTAYRNISTASLNILVKKYEKDFLLFDYNPQPVHIFGNRNMNTY